MTWITDSPSGIPYESSDHELIHDRLWAGFTGTLGFDVGANLGQSLGPMATGGRFARTVAFEPGREAFDILTERFGADPRVVLRPVAVAGHDGELELSLTALSGTELVSPALVGVSPDPHFHDETERRTVPCLTLDTLAARYGMPDFVKVDTEGSELLVLVGAASLLGHAQWLVEWHSPQLRDACREMLAGYRQEIILYPHPDGIYPHGGGEHQTGWLRATL